MGGEETLLSKYNEDTAASISTSDADISSSSASSRESEADHEEHYWGQAVQYLDRAVMVEPDRKSKKKANMTPKISMFGTYSDVYLTFFFSPFLCSYIAG